MTALVALMLLAADGRPPAQLALVESSRVGVTDTQVAQLLGRLAERLESTGFRVRPLPAQCSGERGCLSSLGAREEVDAVVGCSFATALKDIVIDLEAVSARSGLVLAQVTIRVRGTAEPGVLKFVEALKQMVDQERPAPPPAAIVADAPVKISIVPVEPPPAPVEVRESKLKKPAIAITVTAGAAVVACAMMAGVSLADQKQVRVGVDGYAAYKALESRGNALATGSVIAGGAAVGLAVTALVLWLAQ